MARLGLLIAGALVVVVASLHLSCSIGPIWADEFRGRVVDRETGRPVEGVEVFVSSFVVGLWYRGVKGTRWATSDSNGEFVLEEELQMWLVPLAIMSWDPPAVKLYHPDYGFVSYELTSREFPDSGEPFEIRRELDFIAGSHRSCEWSVLCDRITPEACSHLRKIVRQREPDLACARSSEQSRDGSRRRIEP